MGLMGHKDHRDLLVQLELRGQSGHMDPWVTGDWKESRASLVNKDQKDPRVIPGKEARQEAVGIRVCPEKGVAQVWVGRGGEREIPGYRVLVV